MRNDKLQYLVDEYRNAKKSLKIVREDHERIQISLEIERDLTKDLKAEISRAREKREQEKVDYWEDIIDKYLSKDPNWPTKEQVEKAKQKISQDGEKAIHYYERKVKIITKILGSRLAEILDDYEEKMIFMGNAESSTTLSQVIQLEKEEEAEDQRIKEEKGNVNFDKM